MSLKTLSFPIFVTIAVFLGVFWIRPAVVSIMEKQAELSSKAAEFDGLNTTKGNIAALSAERERLLGEDNGRAIYGYLPESVSQEPVVDIFNYLAQQTGIMIGDIAFSKEDRNPADVFAPEGTVEGADPAALVAPPAPVTDSFILTAEIRGSYENIRTFMGSMSKPGRSYDLVAFSVEKDPNTERDASGQPLPDSGLLIGTFSAKFASLPMKVYRQGYLLPVFSSTTFDTEIIRGAVEEWNALPELSAPDTVGRTNPFSL